MAYVVGVDIGSDSIAASVASDPGPDAAAPRSFMLDARRRTESALFVEDDGRAAIGAEAVARGRANPDRLLRGFVDRVGDDVPMVVGSLLVAPEDAVAAVVRWVVDRVEDAEGSPAAGVALVHPVSWGPYRTGIVRGALARAGVVNAVLVPDAEAVAVTYSARQDVPAGTTIAVYDLAGESGRVQLFRTTGGGSVERLSSSESVGAGGRDFDAVLLDHVLGNLQRKPSDVAALHELLRDSRTAKETLSTDAEALVTVSMEDTVTRVRVVRSEFEELIGPVIAATIAALRRLLDDAGLAPEGLGAILLTGGSSRVPLVAQLLSEELGRLLVPDLEPAASAAGTALAALVPLAGDPATGPLVAAVADTDAGHPGPAATRARRFGRSRQFAPPVLVAVAASLAACTILVGPGSGTRLTSRDAALSVGSGVAPAEAARAAAPLSAEEPTAPPAETAESEPQAPTGEEASSASDVFESAGFRTPPEKTTPLVVTGKSPATGSPAAAPGGSGSAAAPSPSPSTTPVIGPTPGPSPDPTPDPTPEPDPTPDPTPSPDPTPDPAPEPDPTPTSTPDPEPTSEPSPEPTADPTSAATPDPTPPPVGSAPTPEG